jgi:RNA recognition motif-containing protein
LGGSLTVKPHYKEFKMNIYVGNLSLGITEEDLKEAFAVFGEVEAVKIIKDNDTGRSKGFGFVEMSDNAHAQSAINGMNDKELKGQTLKVNTARPRTENRGARGGYNSGGRRGGVGGGGGRQGGGRRF